MSFGANPVLDDVAFTVHDREFLTLLGPSGCGKTTTLMSVAGFLRPDAGAIPAATQTFFDARREGVHSPPRTATSASCSSPTRSGRT